MTNKTLLLFDYDWDAEGFARLARSTGHRFDSRGFDLFSFPSNAHLVLFDIDRFVAKLAAQAKAKGWKAVTSQHEQFGALAAAMLAQKMGWPGSPPAAVAACQHKLHAREVLQAFVPRSQRQLSAPALCLWRASTPRPELPQLCQARQSGLFRTGQSRALAR